MANDGWDNPGRLWAHMVERYADPKSLLKRLDDFLERNAWYGQLTTPPAWLVEAKVEREHLARWIKGDRPQRPPLTKEEAQVKTFLGIANLAKLLVDRGAREMAQEWLGDLYGGLDRVLELRAKYVEMRCTDLLGRSVIFQDYRGVKHTGTIAEVLDEGAKVVVSWDPGYGEMACLPEGHPGRAYNPLSTENVALTIL